MSRYVVKHLASRSFDRINFPGQPWRKFVWQDGPFKRKKFALKRQAESRKDRAIFDCGDGFKDYGPTYTRVWVEEVNGG